MDYESEFLKCLYKELSLLSDKELEERLVSLRGFMSTYSEKQTTKAMSYMAYIFEASRRKSE